MRATVIGIGTRTGTDDQIGLKLVEMVGCNAGVSQMDFELWEGMDAAAVAGGLLDIRGPVIIVDAADMGATPGDCRFFDERRAALSIRIDSVSTHGMGLAEGLAVARELGFDQPLSIFAVQPFDLSPGLSLTAEMEQRLSALATVLRNELIARSEAWSREDSLGGAV